ncbi:hypothetical protein ZIOFF_058663 [Zingiber officinale]|uniref:Uncharacterized protein n=1 Tax=Zingiber officinale TaxID=94328 RepID=A0A8J5F6L9_ZINOF|nr:hypothetical protein ZIOFF_058663 [Zingiber officinale]
MLKRNTRLRMEYLYRKSLEGKEREYYEKKRKIREALEEGKPIPTKLRNEEVALRQEIDLEDEYTASSALLVSIDIVLVRITKFMFTNLKYSRVEIDEV